jgi:DNA-binding GntR family transcriptional regulator
MPDATGLSVGAEVADPLPEGRSTGRGVAQSLARSAYERIKRDVLACELRPGDIVAGARLARRYGVSRTPVHEALKMLCSEGLLRVIPRVGYVVSQVTVADVREVFQLRLTLELLAAELAASRATAADLARFATIENKARGPGEETTRIEYRLAAADANRDFHIAIAALSGNRRLPHMIQLLLDESQRILLLDPRFSDEGQVMSQEHAAVVAALGARDPQAARAALGHHIRGAQRRVIDRLLDADGAWAATDPSLALFDEPR